MEEEEKLKCLGASSTNDVDDSHRCSNGPWENGSIADHSNAEEQSQTNQDLKSRITWWLHRPCDPASLGLFRLIFGLLMIHDIMYER